MLLNAFKIRCALKVVPIFVYWYDTNLHRQSAQIGNKPLVSQLLIAQGRIFIVNNAAIRMHYASVKYASRMSVLGWSCH